MKESGGEGRERKRKGKEKNGNVAVGKINLTSGGSLKYSFNLVRKNYIIKWPI